MKLILLSSANSIHTAQWAVNLKKLGEEVIVVSQQKADISFPSDIPVYYLPYKGQMGYFLNVFALKKIIQEVQPDILHAHYASGYGTTARLVNFHPYILSVWGSDVFEFPYRSFIHKYLLSSNLKAPDILVSTSNSMLKQTYQFIDRTKKIDVIPFGVDLSKFTSSYKRSERLDQITIGTVKTLKKVYGIDILLRALAIVQQKIADQHPQFATHLQFRIVGGGPDLNKLQLLAQQLGIDKNVVFTGAVQHDLVPVELENLDIYIALSRQESFGVAVIEAQAMAKPVVVSNVGGLPEVVKHEETGFVVEPENPEAAAEAIIKLILDSKLREEMAYNAEKFVSQNFSWNACAVKMKDLYKHTLETCSKG
ncbi:glycosyltransferase [Acinetobacter sichuanensis]|uniref:Glycosyltransferase n=1 Tax=Acinetobacter sichuanensis TaxID=2136183 RepID=A0A371YND6_9GAMM|nr:glycosyltransferase [Acinetobacter sichuanensis]RFC82979.1 glycosyltransferase family 4 protein [Acinetobacter sichuanensis]